MTPLQITSASVKVMRSHDYCHFEIVLSHNGTIEESVITPEQVDDLRKQAARLADKAVEQYKVAKGNANMRGSAIYDVERLTLQICRIREIAEPDRTPEQKATLKSYDDALWRANHSYDYEDEWNDERSDED